MKLIARMFVAATALVVVAAVPICLRAEKHTIDPNRSVAIVHVYKSGLFSVFAHDHEIRTPIDRGEVDNSESSRVEVWIDADNLRIEDAGISARKRAKLQETMEGPRVLDIHRYQEIHFRSTTIAKQAANRWIVRGELELHGQSHPVMIRVSEQNGRYLGATTLSQKEFGIEPISLLGGTVKVKEQIRVEFEVVTLP